MSQNKKFKKFAAASLAATATVVAVAPAVAAASQFIDVDSAPAHADAIAEFAEKVGLKGYPVYDEAGEATGEREFRPWESIRRDHAAKMLVDMLKPAAPENKEEILEGFSDVNANYDYADEIAAAVDAGYFRGNADGEFMPMEKISREQLVSVLVKAFGLEDTGEEVEVNYDNVSPTHQERLKIAVQHGVTSQALDFNPQGDVYRAQFAKFVLNGEAAKAAQDAEAELSVESVSAINANTLKVTFNQAVDTENVELATTRDGVKVAGSFKWNEDNTVATFEADGKLVKGVHTVTATVDSEEVAKGSVEIKDQYVKEIVISDDTALTGDDRTSAYVFYDVVDQYGESVRNTTSITWTSSTGKPVVANRTTGELKLAKVGEEFRFAEKVYLTGVDAKTGVSIQKELTIGQPRSLDQLNVAGFVKKGTSEVVEGLPSGFKSDEYYMAFQATDQNGNYMTADNTNYKKEDITFVSDNPLLIEKLEVGNPIKTLVIGGEEYAVADVTPGMNVDQGGEVNITAIASKTGNKTVKNIVVGENTILSEFDMLAPAGIIAEGEDVEIDFVARDQNGEKITNFNTLARKSGVKTLQFNAPTNANLVLKEQQDGTAKLVYVAEKLDWDDSRTTDGIDQPVSLTSIVIGGNTSNLMLSVQDKARPVGIKSVDMENALVHGGKAEVTLADNVNDTDFIFVDQYGRTMESDAMVKQAYDFLKTSAEASPDDALKGTEFAGYEYFVQATYKGAEDLYSGAGFVNGVTDVNTNLINNATKKIDTTTNTLTLEADNGDAPTAVTSGMAMNFEIARQKGSDEVESVSPVKTESLSIINIAQVSDITVDEVGKVYIPTTNSTKATGAYISGDDVKDAKAELAAPATGDHQRKVTLSGKYNNQDVTIPASYIDINKDEADFYSITGTALATPDLTTNNQFKVTIGGVTTDIALDTVNYDGGAGLELTALVADINAKLEAEEINITASLSDDKLVLTSPAAFTLEDGDTNGALATLRLTAGTADETITDNTQGKLEIKKVSGDWTVVGGTDQLMWKDLYDVTTAQYLRKDAKQNVTVSVYKDTNQDEVLTTAARTLTISDAAPTLTTIDVKDTWTVEPNITGITGIEDYFKNPSNAKYLDQYDVAVEDVSRNYRVSNVVENKDGYVLNNFSYTGNNSSGLAITGAERNDKFVLTIEATDGVSTVTKDINVTVAPDAKAQLNKDGNDYLDPLLKELERQRTTLNK